MKNSAVKKVLLAFGTRPEAIKMAPLVHQLKRFPDAFKTFVCVTAQHRQMLDQVLEIFNIEPDYDLNVMRPRQTLSDVTASVIVGFTQVIQDVRPDLVIVHGDTTTTMAVALASFYQRVPVAHVEAGLRTYDINSPFPEELNRQIASLICALHFAPTQATKINLEAEGVNPKSVIVTGNTVIDALLWVVHRLNSEPDLQDTLDRQFEFLSVQRKLILVTGHRRENFGVKFEQICYGLKSIADLNPDVEIVYPVHPNPNVQEPVNRILSECRNIHLIPPLDYLPFVYLMRRAYIIVTDSGGIQEEAPSLGKPVLVTRDTTERPEAVAAGVVKLVGTKEDVLVDEITLLLNDSKAYAKMSSCINPYGEGISAKLIVEEIKNYFDE